MILNICLIGLKLYPLKNNITPSGFQIPGEFSFLEYCHPFWVGN
jgi:hypothetical protein